MKFTESDAVAFSFPSPLQDVDRVGSAAARCFVSMLRTSFWPPIIHPRLQVELATADGGTEFGKRERFGDGEQCDALNQGCLAMLQKHDGF